MEYYNLIKKIILNIGSFLLLCAYSIQSQTNPTPQEIVSAWTTLSGGLSAKLVWSQDSTFINVMDLMTGTVTTVSNQIGCTCKWSPDGTRILAQNAQHEGASWDIYVLNADGSNKQLIWQGNWVGEGIWGWEQRACGWIDNNWIVYSQVDKIVKTQLDSNNSAVSTVVINSEMTGEALEEVGCGGNYVCWLDYWGNRDSGGWHRPRVKNLITGEIIDYIPREDDACALSIKPDSSGTSIMSMGSHEIPSSIVTISGMIIDSMPPMPDHRIAGHRWSNNLDYITTNGEEYVDEYYAWINRYSTKGAVFLGNNIWRPASGSARPG